MIRSYAGDIGKDLFNGNWGLFSSRQALQPIEDCFIDLRIIDAAATRGDLQRLFRERCDESPNGTFMVREPPGAVAYRIKFRWTGEDAEDVDVSLSDWASQGWEHIR